MTGVALKGLAGRKLRTALTMFAIILGVAMVSGTYVLTDTIDRAFNGIFQESYANTDVVVSGRTADISFQGDHGAGADPGGEARRGACPSGCRGRHRQHRRPVENSS